MTRKIKLHDGIIGALISLSVGLGWAVDVRWLGLAGLTAVIMISSAFTGFCPIHYTINKLLPDDPKS